MSGKKERQKTPGPGDYRTVEVTSYRRQSHVVPKMTIPTAGRSSSAERLVGKVGPQSYKPNLDIRLKHNPSCTIGNTVREVGADRETTAKKPKSPGPGSYRINRNLSPGHGQTIFKQKRSTFKIEPNMPGPQDYHFDPM